MGPLMAEYLDKSEQYDTLIVQTANIDSKLLTEVQIKANGEKVEVELEKIYKEYPYEIYNDEIDALLTGICLSNGLSPTALRLRAGEKFQEALADEFEIKSSKDELEGEVFVPDFRSVQAMMQLEGNYTNFQKLLKQISGTPNIRVLQFKCRSEGTTEFNPTEYEIEFEIIMAVKPVEKV
jgi:hypothetical protein